MFFFNVDLSDTEEIFQKTWPVTNSDTSYVDDIYWDILNIKGAQEDNRHWIKQNTNSHLPKKNTKVTYH